MAPLIMVPLRTRGVYLQPVEGWVSSQIYMAGGLIPKYGKLFYGAYAVQSGQPVGMCVDLGASQDWVIDLSEYYQ
jgi:hypothetical protein